MYVCMHVCMYVSMYVCMCVRLCVCGSAAAQTDGSILIKFSTNDLADIYEVVFLDFEISKSMTSWRPFCTFPFASLSRSQFCFDFLQHLTKDRKLSTAVCYLKLARLVRNFCQYSRPRLRKKIKMAANFFLN